MTKINKKRNDARIKEILLENHFDENLIDEVLSSKKFHRTLGERMSRTDLNTIDINYSLCRRLYEEEYLPLFKLAMLYGISDGSFAKLYRLQGFETKGHFCGANSQNTFFETIDTKEKAYFLGLIAADGCLTEKESICTVSLTLSESDRYMIDKFNEVGDFQEKIYESHSKSERPRSLLMIGSTKVFQDLTNLGIYPNKSDIGCSIPEQIKDDKELVRHFIRGYYDGNGIAFSDGRIGFCGCKKIISQIWKFLTDNYDMNKTKITYNKSNHIYYAHWGAYKDRRRFYEEMYRDADDLYLIRKREKIANHVLN